MYGKDVSIEHLVPKAHGGPTHLSNLFLAHKSCNAKAGHLSASEKLKIRDRAHQEKFATAKSTYSPAVCNRFYHNSMEAYV